MDIKEALPFVRVRYVPRHAQGDANHPDCEAGTISRSNESYIFVKFDKNVDALGFDQATAQACDPDTLVVEQVTYVKIVRNDEVFYIRSRLLATATKFAAHCAPYRDDEFTRRHLMQFSDFVVNRELNSVVKCRQTYETVFDAYTKNPSIVSIRGECNVPK